VHIGCSYLTEHANNPFGYVSLVIYWSNVLNFHTTWELSCGVYFFSWYVQEHIDPVIEKIVSEIESL